MKRLPMVISEAIFFVLYIIIKTIVLMGEVTQEIFTFPGKINYTKLKLSTFTIKFSQNNSKIPEIEPETKHTEPKIEKKEALKKTIEQSQKIIHEWVVKAKKILKKAAENTRSIWNLSHE